MGIKNIIFDIGNVLLRWDPLAITTSQFPDHVDVALLSQQLFKSATWYDLNLGKISETTAIARYQQELNIDKKQLYSLMTAMKKSLLPLPGSFELLDSLYQADIPLYALTDNTHEIMAYLQEKYDFWYKFRGVVVSATVGSLKPSPEIYRYLLNSYQLNPSESLFIDDYHPNVDGAIKMGMVEFQFVNAGESYVI